MDTSVVDDLAPSGSLRVSINLGNRCSPRGRLTGRVELRSTSPPSWRRGREFPSRSCASTLRVLEPAFMRIEQGLGAPRSRSDHTHLYLQTFVEELEVSGFIAVALERSGRTDVTLAPPV